MPRLCIILGTPQSLLTILGDIKAISFGRTKLLKHKLSLRKLDKFLIPTGTTSFLTALRHFCTTIGYPAPYKVGT